MKKNLLLLMITFSSLTFGQALPNGSYYSDIKIIDNNYSDASDSNLSRKYIFIVKNGIVSQENTIQKEASISSGNMTAYSCINTINGVSKSQVFVFLKDSKSDSVIVSFAQVVEDSAGYGDAIRSFGGGKVQKIE
jgi:hypothetical protein